MYKFVLEESDDCMFTAFIYKVDRIVDIMPSNTMGIIVCEQISI